MSSIISDLFFGSKQNILDNYLGNQHENQQQSSMHHKQETVIYASFIELVIRIPALAERGESMMFKVEAEMGTKSDEGFIEVRPNQRQSEAIVLVLNELQKQDLNRYTNIKVTISEGKFSKIHGFIPIESIKNIASSFSNEKIIIVQMKGKKNFPFSSIQCIIRTEFPNNNVLNSQILRSMEKDHESYLRSKEQVSDQSSQIQVQAHHRPTVKRRGNESSVNDQGRKYLQKQDNIVVDGKKWKKKSSGNIDDKLHLGMTEFVKEIKSTHIEFTRIELIQSLQKQEEKVRLKLGQRIFGLCEAIEITQITKQGVNIELLSDNQAIGSIHLSPLLLALQKISGEFPIYSSQQQCLGTITIQSPNEPSQKHSHPTIHKQAIINQAIKQPQIDIKKQLVCLSIDKIVMINSLNPLNSSSFLDSSQSDLYDFTKIQQSKLEVLVRINGVTSKFTDVMLHYNIDRDLIKIAELRRRQGLFCSYYEDCTEEQLSVEIQIFSAYRLISYSRASFAVDEKISHKFIPGDTSCPFFHSTIHLRAIRLQVQAELFQQHKMSSIFNVLEDLLSTRIMLSRTDDSQIKSIMALHKKTTYIELKKLLTLLQSSSKLINQFQQSQIKCVYSKENPERNEAMIKLSYRLLEEFLYIDIKNQKIVRKEDFEKVIEFYKEDLEIALEKDFKAFVSQPVVKNNNILFTFFVAGFYYVKHQVQEPAQPKQQANKQAQSAYKQPQHAQLIQTIKEVSVISQPSYLISKISIINAHLLNLGKAPNLTLNITKKISYSNSNPQFVIEKQVSLLSPIQICHKSIAEDRIIVLAEFKPSRRQTLYELEPSGKCYAKITWGL